MPPTTAANSRVRNTTRRRADDDSAYVGSSGLGRKRTAGDKAEGLDRAKRKRVETPSLVPSAYNSFPAQTMKRGDLGEPKPQYMDFAALPAEALHRYLITWDLVPAVQQPIDSAEAPPLPASLLNGAYLRETSPMSTTVTPANRPRREVKDPSKRRSSRLVDDSEEVPDSVAVMADMEGVHQTLAQLAERHFVQRTPAKEAEVVRSFLLAVDRNRGMV